ncbi:MAG: ABC transporter ATP-binding protein [Marinovum sp.]|nr:ABC transporter ATP-binding protein [Marinovum sp.]
MTAQLRTEKLTLSYGKNVVLENLTIEIPDGAVTALVGPNACGKSTLLRALARLIKPRSGAVLLEGRKIQNINTRMVARTIALLPQQAEAPAGMRVIDLVGRGRTPHQSPIQQWSVKDETIVMDALSQVGLLGEQDRALEDLSGGQRQRAWIAMVLAQQTEILLLDEPTTFLDLRYQIDALKLVANLQKERDLTVVMVLHDINLAARFAHHIVGMKDGTVVTQGPPKDVVTAKNIDAIYGLKSNVIIPQGSDAPHVIAL